MYRPTPTRLALRVLTVVFWISATIFVVSLAVSSLAGDGGELSSWMVGLSLLVVMLSSGRSGLVGDEEQPRVRRRRVD
jgi:hypothetical protein